MTKTGRRAAVMLTAAIVLAGCASSPSATPLRAETTLPAETTSAIEATLAETMAATAVPGAVVAVCAPGYADWVTVAGVSDLDAKTAMSPDLVWGLRSVTKSFTATLVLQLVDEGRLKLTDPLSTWLPGFPNADRITVEQLANMSAGVPEYITEEFITDYSENPQRDFTGDELIAYAATQPPQFDPGAEHVYVNTSTLLLGKIVEEVTGQAFADALDERIITPLGLDGTRYPATAGDWSGPHPTAYQPGSDGALDPQPNNFTIFGAAGAMTSTVTDLCRWGAALGSGELLDPATHAARVQGTALDEGPEYDTYGQGIGTVNGWVGHTGEGLGVTVLVMHDPDTGRTAVILMNLSGTGEHIPTTLFRKISATLDAIPAIT